MLINDVIENAPLEAFNTLRIKSTAKYFVEVNSISELKDILSNDIYSGEKILVIGNGSNILLSEHYDGIVIKINIRGKTILSENENFVILDVGAGEDWIKLVEYTISKKLGGIENLALIPGTAGAAPIQNISGYGQSLRNSLLSLDAINIKNGKLRHFTLKECGLGYRDSIFKQKLKNKYVITNIQLKLRKKPILDTTYKSQRESITDELSKIAQKPYSIKDVYKAIVKIRKRKLPDPHKIGTAGSFFKNHIISQQKLKDLQKRYPDINFYISNDKITVPAAWLIDKGGLSNKKLGNCGVWEKQPLNIVNYGNATSEEMIGLINLIKNKIHKEFDIELENEVEII